VFLKIKYDDDDDDNDDMDRTLNLFLSMYSCARIYSSRAKWSANYMDTA